MTCIFESHCLPLVHERLIMVVNYECCESLEFCAHCVDVRPVSCAAVELTMVQPSHELCACRIACRSGQSARLMLLKMKSMA
jgi:hypothetical protein